MLFQSASHVPKGVTKDHMLPFLDPSGYNSKRRVVYSTKRPAAAQSLGRGTFSYCMGRIGIDLVEQATGKRYCGPSAIKLDMTDSCDSDKALTNCLFVTTKKHDSVQNPTEVSELSQLIVNNWMKTILTSQVHPVLDPLDACRALGNKMISAFGATACVRPMFIAGRLRSLSVAQWFLDNKNCLFSTSEHDVFMKAECIPDLALEVQQTYELSSLPSAVTQPEVRAAVLLAPLHSKQFAQFEKIALTAEEETLQKALEKVWKCGEFVAKCILEFMAACLGNHMHAAASILYDNTAHEENKTAKKTDALHSENADMKKQMDEQAVELKVVEQAAKQNKRSQRDVSKATAVKAQHAKKASASVAAADKQTHFTNAKAQAVMKASAAAAIKKDQVILIPMGTNVKEWVNLVTFHGAHAAAGKPSTLQRQILASAHECYASLVDRLEAIHVRVGKGPFKRFPIAASDKTRLRSRHCYQLNSCKAWQTLKSLARRRISNPRRLRVRKMLLK
jgi:hypothetical protein